MPTKQSEFALRLAASGFHIFPLEGNGKLPAIKEYPNKATTDPDQVQKWFGNGKVRNIGISTSHFSMSEALVVIDLDLKNGKRGDLSLVQLELEGFELPPTLTVSTPSGGSHLYYRVPKAVRQGVDLLGNGLDVRSLGGYVVGPKSEIDGRTYEITHHAQVAQAPDWLVQRLGRARERAVAPEKALVASIEPERAAQRA
ncbi:MAG TPA: bifunctional DNA primase/polymerase, partial [Terracidiphilus sp.]|nr:bifunctional DNA primase/polymerase [Terracidiphilus sp.]